MRTDVLIAGVGGQGILLASKVICNAALRQNLHVSKAETHGMAQRGGSVVTHVRYSDEVIYSPLIREGKADVLIAFEPLEALRYMNYVSEDSALIVNKNPLKVPGYPEVDEIIAELKKHKNTVVLDALELAEEAGHILTQNTVLLGAASRYLNLNREVLEETIKDTLKKAVKENLRAFRLGAQL